MPNARAITIIGNNVPPDMEEKFNNWFYEAYVPILLKTETLRIDRYRIIKTNPVFPELLTLFYYEDINAVKNHIQNRDQRALVGDFNITFKRIERVWVRRGYELIKSFRSDTQNEEDTRVENASVLHLEVLRLLPEQEEKYNNWFVRWAYRVYIPILMKLPGLKAYNRFHHSGQDFQESRDYRAQETDYPAYLSLLYFEDAAAFEAYERSPELIAFREAIRMNFPGSLDYKWYVQYQLLKSWRK